MPGERSNARRRRFVNLLLAIAASLAIACCLFIFRRNSRTAQTQPDALAHWGATSTPGAGLNVSDVVAGDQHFTVAAVDLDQSNLTLFWKRFNGSRLANFKALEEHSRNAGRRLLFATNAGIFDTTHTPCGLHIQEGHQLSPLNLEDGDGNFFLKPNGVFLIDERGARIIDSTQYADTAQNVRLATQSGPLLLTDGQINPRLLPESRSRKVRSGVGVSDAHQVYFVISKQPVTFHEFASIFNQLKCADALYLDGVISRFYIPGSKDYAKQDGDFAGLFAVTSVVNQK